MPDNDDPDFERKIIPFREVVEPAQPQRLRPLEMARWDAIAVPEPDWTVLNRIPRRQVALFSGEGAMGKSTLLLQLCAAHAGARDWLFTMPEPGPAIFLDAEDDQDVIHRRLAAVTRHYRCSFGDLVRGGLQLFSLAGQDTVLATPNVRNGRVEPTPLYFELLAMVRDVRPVMIGLASAANFFAGNENDRNQVQQFISLITQLAIASNGSVVLVSHPSLTGITSNSGMSGSTQWHNAVRARFFLHGVKDGGDGEPIGDLREIEFKKNNYGPVADKITLQWRDGMFLPLPKPSTLQRAAQDARDDELFLRAVTWSAGRSQNVSPNKGPTYAPSLLMDAPEVKAARINGMRLKFAMDRLIEAGRIRVDEFGPASHRRSKLVIP